MKITLSIAFLFLALFCSAQVIFQKTYQGIYDQTHAQSIQQTNDGGYIIAGYTDSLSLSFGSDAYLIKTNYDGAINWTLGLKGNNTTYSTPQFFCVRQTNDGGYIAVGNLFYADVDGFPDIYIVRTNGNGDTLWTRIIRGNESIDASKIQQTSDGGFIILGSDFPTGSNDFVLAKLDNNGNLNWIHRCYNDAFGSDESLGNSIQQTNDGGYIICGRSVAFGNYLCKMDSAGNPIWTNSYTVNNWDEYFSSVQQTSDGGFIVAGGTGTYPSPAKIFLVKTDIVGNLIFGKSFGGSVANIVRSVRQTNDGGYIIAGKTSSFTPDSTYNMYLIKTDSNGNLLWSKTFGGSVYDEAFEVTQTNDGGYAIIGNSKSFSSDSSSEIYFIKTDSLGNSGCNEISPPTIEGTPVVIVTSLTTLVSNEVHSYPIYGLEVESGGIENNICFTTKINDIPINDQDRSPLSLFPSPTPSTFTIRMENPKPTPILYSITNVLGEVIQEGVIPNSNSSIINHQLSIVNSPGVYFVNVRMGNESFNSKVIITN